MKNPVAITLHSSHKEGTIHFSHLTAGDKIWLSDALIDSFLVDDAEYHSADRLVHIENWHTDIDEEGIRQELPKLLHELGYDNIRLEQTIS